MSGIGSARCLAVGVAAMVGLGAPARAQSLLVDPPGVPTTPAGEPDPAAPVRQYSMLAVRPPQPRTFAVHDLITIIVDENSRSSSTQTLDTEKEYEIGATLESVVDPAQLIEARLRQAMLADVSLIDAEGEREFEGEGEYEREDRFTARLTAEVIDVKPNGTLVLEARKRIARDEEISLLVLSGRCRSEDVTRSNTVLSSQMADLTLVQKNEGSVRKAAKKGVLTRFLETVFAF